jgi:hypothetical protein
METRRGTTLLLLLQPARSTTNYHRDAVIAVISLRAMDKSLSLLTYGARVAGVGEPV